MSAVAAWLQPTLDAPIGTAVAFCHPRRSRGCPGGTQRPAPRRSAARSGGRCGCSTHDSSSSSTSGSTSGDAEPEQPPASKERTGLGNSLNSGSLASSSYDEAPGGAWHSPLSGIAHRLRAWTRATAGRLLYLYYNWRTDTFSDLQLFLAFNLSLFAAGAALQGTLFAHPDSAAAAAEPYGWWLHFYEVCKTVFGQDMPDLDSPLPQQVFAVATVAVGLASFAVVLTLVEQVLLEVLSANVSVGSRVWEQGHTVLLCWCETAGQAQQITRMLKQLCLAYRAEGGRTIVVLTQRGKLEMEEAFRSRIPPQRRHGSTFVFRCGSPLDPEALRLVSLATAASVIISGDYSRTPMESDTQVVRAAVLLDELLARVQVSSSSEQASSSGGRGTWTRQPQRPVVVAQVKGSEAAESLSYTCGSRVQAVPTKQINAERVAHLVMQPVAATLLRKMNDFGSGAHLTFYPLPSHLEGLTVADLQLHLPNATLVGLQRGSGGSGSSGTSYSLRGGRSGATAINAPADAVARRGDSLVLLSTALPIVLQQPLALPPPSPGAVPRSISQRWRVRTAAPHFQPTIETTVGSSDEGTLPATLQSTQSMDSMQSMLGHSEYRLPSQYYGASSEPQRLLLCGWGSSETMAELLRALGSGPQALPPGSSVTFVNQNPDCREELACMARASGITPLQLRHVLADPRSRAALAASVDVGAATAALVVSDMRWRSGGGGGGGEDPPGAGGDVSGGGGDTDLTTRVGPDAVSQPDALRMDAAVLAVQLNIRILLEACGRPDINIVCETQSHQGLTRYEDADRLPLGVTFNTASFSARLLAQVAVEPRFLPSYLQLCGEGGSQLTCVDAAELAGEQEEVAYVELQRRALVERQAVLLGYYSIPERSTGIQLAVNPPGERQRCAPRVWNAGDGRCKLLLLAPVPGQAAGPQPSAEAARLNWLASGPLHRELALPQSAPVTGLLAL